MNDIQQQPKNIDCKMPDRKFITALASRPGRARAQAAAEAKEAGRY